MTKRDKFYIRFHFFIQLIAHTSQTKSGRTCGEQNADRSLRSLKYRCRGYCVAVGGTPQFGFSSASDRHAV